MKSRLNTFHEELNDHLKRLGTYPASHDAAVDALTALGADRAADAAQVIHDQRIDDELSRDLAHLPSPSFVDTCLETAYGATVRLPFQIRVF